jgi:aminomethyltransferase
MAASRWSRRLAAGKILRGGGPLDEHANLKKTPFYPMHLKYGGKVVDFGGWALSVQFSGILDEHRTVREQVGLFDVSHMGEATVKGPQALEFLQHMVSRDLSTMKDNQVYYTHLLYPAGGVVDDLMVTKLGDNDYYLVINASNAEKDVAWLKEHAAEFKGVKVQDISAQTGEVALQGPYAQATLQKLMDADLSALKYYHVIPKAKVAGFDVMVSRTGYTGEDGFEIMCRPEDGAWLWEAIMEAGEEFGIKPIGLGARDSLRFEAGMPLYGQELDAETSPLEARLARYLSLDKPGFIGREALHQRQDRGLSKVLVGLEMVDRGIARHNYPVLKDGANVGYVTTGMYSPTLNKNIAMAYVPPALSAVGTQLEVEIRGKALRARVVKTPFYRRPRK